MMFLYIFASFSAYVRQTIVLLEPIKANEYYEWSHNDLALFFLVIQLCGVIPIALLLIIFGKYLSDYFVCIGSTILLTVAVICIAILPFIQNNYGVGKVFIYTTGILRAMSGTAIHIVIRTMIAKAVPENIQTMADAIRNTGFEFGYDLAEIVLSLPSRYLAETVTGLNIILCIILSWFVAEKDRYEYLKLN